MAYNQLQTEADEMFGFLWTKAGGKMLRRALGKEFHIFRMSYHMTFENFKKIRAKGTGDQGDATNPNPKKWGKRIFEENEQILKELTEDLIFAIGNELKNDPDPNVKLINHSKRAIKFSIATGVGGTPYKKIDTAKKDGSEKVFTNPKYDWILKATGKTAAGVSHIAHAEGVALLKGRLSESFFEGTSSAIEEEGEENTQAPIDTEYLNSLRDAGLQAYQEKIEELLPGLEIRHHRDAVMEKGKLKNIVKIYTDLDSAFHNEVIQANSRLEAPFSEKDISMNIKKAFKAGQKAIREKYEKDGVKKETARGRSQTFIEAMRSSIITPEARKAAKKSSSALKIKKAKSMRPRTAEAKKKDKKTAVKFTQKNHRKDIAATGNLPKATAARSQGSEAPGSLTPLIALLNQKLPRTVAENMGPPGLTNQTGRFAASVRVTDATRTSQGFPSIGYTYRKNPYQVFEPGAGAAPWATSDRDPRKVIVQSIREIAAQLAIGRFYTRRV